MNPLKASADWHFEFLGTGTSQGVPMIGCDCKVCQSDNPKDQRLRSSFLVERMGTRILIDAGPDLRQQLLRAKTPDIDAVLITHQHQDHTAGLDELRAINFIQGHSIPIYCSEAVEARLREQYSYIFQNSKYPGIPQIDLIRIPEGPFQIGNIELEALELQHANLAVHGFRFGKLAYLTDVNYIPDSEWDKLEGLEVFILNALRHEAHHSHFTLSEALAIADRLEVPQFYATHISHQLGLHAEVESELKEGRNLAYDGLQLTLASS